jgi:hypothetical protein
MDERDQVYRASSTINLISIEKVDKPRQGVDGGHS